MHDHLNILYSTLKIVPIEIRLSNFDPISIFVEDSLLFHFAFPFVSSVTSLCQYKFLIGLNILINNDLTHIFGTFYLNNWDLFRSIDLIFYSKLSLIEYLAGNHDYFLALKQYENGELPLKNLQFLVNNFIEIYGPVAELFLYTTPTPSDFNWTHWQATICEIKDYISDSFWGSSTVSVIHYK